MFTQRRIALHFRSTTFIRKRGRVATAKVTFSNKSAPVLCKRNAVLLLFCAVFRPIRSSVNVVLVTKSPEIRKILSSQMWWALPTFPVRKIYNKKFANFAGLYIFRILQHFAIQFCNFTNFRMLFLFLGVMKDFVLIACICQL